MARTVKSTKLYNHPFTKGYWRDAAAELKDTKMLVFAALIIALRVALKMVKIPLGPSLDITPAFLANALGSMIYGPVVGGFAAIISDFLGVILRGDTYFLPYALTEISSSVIFGMFFYRARVTPTRVILSRFTICVAVNILLTIPIDNWYQQFTYGYSNTILTLPRILKNLFMFPIESAVLTVFLRAIQPATFRMKLTYDRETRLNFTKKQVTLLVALAIVGTGAVFAYLPYHYSITSVSGSYSVEQRIEANQTMQTHLLEQSDQWDDMKTLTVVEAAYEELWGSNVTYHVAVYEVDEAVEVNDDLWKLSKSKASKKAENGEGLQRVATVIIVVNEETGEVSLRTSK